MGKTTNHGVGHGIEQQPRSHDPRPAGGGEDVLGQEIATAPGDIPVKLVVERARSIRRQFRHDNTIDPLGPVPDHAVGVVAVSGEETPVAHATLFYTTDGSEPGQSSASADMRVVERRWDVLSGYVTTWRGTIPAQTANTIVRYRIGGWLTTDAESGQAPDLWAQDGQGFWFRFEPAQGVTTFAFHVEDEENPTPEWVRDGVIYQIFLDRFRTSAPDDTFQNTGFRGIHGGTIEGVLRSLDYLHELGATCLWLSPLHPAETYHRYDSKDYDDVDPLLGGRDDLKQLTTEGSKLNMRFLMDFVPSHLSWHHPALLDAQRDRNAATASWFTFYRYPDRYRTFLDLAPFLPSINTDDPGARQHLIESAVGWLTDCGISGFRLDHAIGPSMDFWVAFRAATKQARSDSFTVGEVTDTPDSMRRYRQRLDAVLDFPLARALRSTFALGSWNVEQLDNFLNAYEPFMQTGPFRVSFLDNHDMDRFLFVAGNDVERLKMAALCQFALEPTPVIYYGTEIGLRQAGPASDRAAGGDAQVRGDMIWDENGWDRDLLDFYQRLIGVRKEYVVLRSGGRRTIHVDADRQIYAFVRGANWGHELISTPDLPSVIAVFNLGSDAQRIDLSGLQTSNRQLLIEVRAGKAGFEKGGVELEGRAAALVAVMG